MYNLIEYCKNYLKTPDILWSYTKDIPVDPITNSKSFKYKASITKKTAGDEIQKKLNFLFH